MAQVTPVIAQAEAVIGADAPAEVVIGPRTSAKSVAWAIPDQPQVKINLGDDANANAPPVHVYVSEEGSTEPKLSMDLDSDQEDILRISSGLTGTESLSVGKNKTQSHALSMGNAAYKSEGTQSCAVTAVATQSRTSHTYISEASPQIVRSRSQMSKSFGIEDAPLVDKMSSTKTLPPSSRILRLRKFLESKVWTTLSGVGLFLALFGGAIFIIGDVPDDPGIDH